MCRTLYLYILVIDSRLHIYIIINFPWYVDIAGVPSWCLSTRTFIRDLPIRKIREMGVCVDVFCLINILSHHFMVKLLKANFHVCTRMR